MWILMETVVLIPPSEKAEAVYIYQLYAMRIWCQY